MYNQRYITKLIIFENQANRVLQLLGSDHGFIYSKMREDCLQKNITWKKYTIGQKLSYTTMNNHQFLWASGRDPYNSHMQRK